MAEAPEPVVTRRLAPGDAVGAYTITEEIGVGGYGHVYRARDAKLGRDVALKGVRHSGDAAPLHAERLAGEARLMASLSHPNLCVVYDLVDVEGGPYLVMELLAGETLAHRLQRASMRPMASAEALGVAAAIADGLAYVHERGVVHQDVTPGNVMLTPTGVKLLDFGIARMRSVAAGPERTETAPVLSARVAGTLRYMAPEQLEGRTDHRTDLFALGCVLYEMLTGRPAFGATTKDAIVASIQAGEPPLDATMLPEVQRVLRRCLAKRPEARWQSAADLADQLRFVATAPASGPAAAARSRRWLAAVIIAGVVGAALGGSFSGVGRSATAPAAAFTIPAPPGQVLDPFGDGGAPALSPDGSHVAFIAASPLGNDQLWVRELGRLEAELIAGSDGAAWPMWSPDGREIAFSADGQLKRVALNGRAVQPIATVDVRSGTWGADGIFVDTPTGAVLQVGLDGRITPVVLPVRGRGVGVSLTGDGRLLVHLSEVEGKPPGIWLISVDRSSAEFLTSSDTGGMMAAGQLFFVRGRALLRQVLDARSGLLRGTPSVVLSGMHPIVGGNQRLFGVSSTGVVAALVGTLNETRLAWFTRSGQPERKVTEFGSYSNPALSPDGSRIAVNQIDEASGRRELWMIDLARNVSSRLTHGPRGSGWGRWSPNGAALAYQEWPSDGLVIFNLHRARPSEVQLPSKTGPFGALVRDWLPDDRHLLVLHLGDLWVVPLSAGQEPRPLVQSPGFDAEGRVSPDGRWIAYSSDASGRFEIYVAPMADPKAARQVSNGGGLEPIWRRDSRELYYLSPERVLTAVDVSGPPLTASSPHALFEMPTGVLWDANVHYDAAADGQRFIVAETRPSPTPLAITVLTDWRTGERR